MPPPWPNGNYLYLRLARTHCEEQSKLGHSKCIFEIAGEQLGATRLFCSAPFILFGRHRLISKSVSLISFCSPHLGLVKEFSGAARARIQTPGDG